MGKSLFSGWHGLGMRVKTWMKRFIALTSDQHLYIYRSERVRQLSALEVLAVVPSSH